MINYVYSPITNGQYDTEILFEDMTKALNYAENTEATGFAVLDAHTLTYYFKLEIQP